MIDTGGNLIYLTKRHHFCFVFFPSLIKLTEMIIVEHQSTGKLTTVRLHKYENNTIEVQTCTGKTHDTEAKMTSF